MSGITKKLIKNGIYNHHWCFLNWKTGDEVELKNYIVERGISFNTFTEIGRVNPKASSSGSQHYNFVDTKPEIGKNFYRLKLLYNNNSFTYSNTIVLSKSQKSKNIHSYPNPVSNMLTIDFEVSTRHVYKITLLNMLIQGVWEATFITGNNNTLQIPKPKSNSKSIYALRCIDMNTNEEFSEKVIFL